MYLIYKHTNKINGKRYVGWAIVKHKQLPQNAMMRRWKTHCSVTKKGSRSLFHCAIRKYGEDVFNHEILDVMSSRCGILQAEKLWITRCCSYAFDHPGSGYNMTKGGEGGAQTPEICKRQADKMRGRPAPNRRKVGLFLNNTDLSPVHVFDSVRNAQITCRLGSSYTIYKWCTKTTRYKHRGFFWRYADNSSSDVVLSADQLVCLTIIDRTEINGQEDRKWVGRGKNGISHD